MQLKRIRLFKTVSIVFAIVVLLASVSLLMSTGVIRFDWSERAHKRWSYSKQKERAQRIIVLGDSQLVDWKLDHCLYKDIYRFSDQHGLGCVNAAGSGFGPIEYLDRLNAIGPDYKPHLAVLFYYSGNDLSDVMYRGSNEPKRPHIPWRETAEMRSWKEPMLPVPMGDLPDMGHDRARQALANPHFDWDRFEREGVDPTIIQYAKNRLLHPGGMGPELVNPHILVVGTWQRRYLYDNNAIDTVESRFTWYRILMMFERLLDLSEALDCEVALVVIPSTVQVSESHHDFYRKITFEVGSDLTQASAPQQLLREFAEATGVRFVDLLPHFKRHPNPTQLYFENDDHLSEAGHREAFIHVERELLKPFAEGTVASSSKSREREFYRRYTDWAIEFIRQDILNNPTLLRGLEDRARAASVTLESLVMQRTLRRIDRLQGDRKVSTGRSGARKDEPESTSVFSEDFESGGWNPP